MRLHDERSAQSRLEDILGSETRNTQNPQAAEFYAFLKTLETYHKIFTKDSTLVLSTDSDIFALLKHAATKTKGSPIPLETPPKPSP